MQHPPDTLACIFRLRNRRRENWREWAVVSDDGSVSVLALLDEAGERARDAHR